MSKAAKPQTTVERWFPWKRYVPVVVAKKQCPLTYHHRLVYSYWFTGSARIRMATKVKIEKALRLDKKAVVKTITALTVHNLLADDQGQYRAKEPD